MYLLINNQTNVVESCSTTLLQLQLQLQSDPATHRIDEIANEDFQDDMVSSIFTDINNYVVFPETINGNVIPITASDGTQWVDPRTDDETWVEVRAKRDAELDASDWTQISDSPLSGSKQTEWATWRTDLRDLPQSYNDPHDAETVFNLLVENKP